MFALTDYFDASYDSDKTVTIVAGFVSSVLGWDAFDVDWKILLASSQVPYFHMKEFHHSQKVFRSWKGDENRKQLFLRRAIDVIDANVMRGFACVVEHKAFDAVNDQYCLYEEIGNPYALAGIECVASVNAWKAEAYPNTPIMHIFERDDYGQTELKRAMDWGNQPLPDFKPGRDDLRTGEPGLTPLQAADFAAWEIRKGHLQETGMLADRQYSDSLKKLAKISPHWTILTENDLLNKCKKFNIEPRRNT